MARLRLSCKILVVLGVSPQQHAANVKVTATLMLTAMLGCTVFNEKDREHPCQDVDGVKQGVFGTLTIALVRRLSCKLLVVLGVSPHQNAATVKVTATRMLTALLGCIAFNGMGR